MKYLTDYHAKYLSYELTKKSSANSIEKLIHVLSDAKVEPKPHQIEASLFAFKSPLSKGAILADEVGLGKTIEAGIVISQKWAENKRKMLIIVPATLRKQWYEELKEKFYLDSIILEAKSFNDEIAKGNFNPFIQDKIIICSYNFVSNKEAYVKSINWDLVIIDEAHRLRNVYKTTNKISRRIKTAIENSPKILLTATPLQNSLLELYGLTSFIDDYIFGDLKSFKSQFTRIDENDKFLYNDLKERIAPICKRTLRKQVLEYINYTNRLSITQEFYPSDAEQELYDKITLYLQRENLKALPPSQRWLMTLILRKLLASSSFAIAGTLRGLVNKLNKILETSKILKDEEYSEILNDYSEYEELKDEEDFENKEEVVLTENDVFLIKKEIEELKEYAKLAESIKQNAKGEVLLTALNKGFQEMKRLGAPEKALIFTESTRTQEYIYSILQKTEYKDSIVFFNGSNNDELSKKIYNNWLEKHKGESIVTGSKTADKRSALIEYFKNDAKIMIATEAAAEGVNLQFCSMIVNYDLPWNPQRVEQRIGRCHRYGQKFDVVVINFLNKRNEADQRVYELLKEKFKLFDGVFGASDEVLGSIETGVDFERRINEIYQNCRKPEEIKLAFDNLQKELEEKIDSKMKITTQKLFENFDEEVIEKLKVSQNTSKEYLNQFERELLLLTRYKLENDFAIFKNDTIFEIFKQPYKDIQKGIYEYKSDSSNIKNYRIGHPLAQDIINEYKEKELESVEIIFDYTNSEQNIEKVKPYVGKTGEISLKNVDIETFEEENFLIFSGIDEDGNYLDDETCRKIFNINNSKINSICEIENKEKLNEIFDTQFNVILDRLLEKNNNFFDSEIEKLEKWAEDVKKSIELELKNLDMNIKFKKAEARKLLKLEDKLNMQKEIKELEKKRNNLRLNLFEEQDKVDNKKDKLIEHIEKKMKQKIEVADLFTIKWKIV